MVKFLLNIFHSAPDFGGVNQMKVLQTEMPKILLEKGSHNPGRELSFVLPCQEKLLLFPNEKKVYILECLDYRY